MKCECGQYGMLLTTLPDGTDIYHCMDCGTLWGERLVKFEVSFQLSELPGDGRNGDHEGSPTLMLVPAISS